MKLVSGTLSPPTAISASCLGSFTSPSAHEAVVVRGSSILELWCIHKASSTASEGFAAGALCTRIGMLNTFSSIASVASFRIAPCDERIKERDVLIVTGESGFIAVLRFAAGTEISEAQRGTENSILFSDDYSVQEGASPFYPMLYFPLESTSFADFSANEAITIGGGWERLFHAKVDRSALSAGWAPLCSPGTHTAVQPNCFMIAGIERNKMCLQMGKLSSTALRYEKSIASTDADAIDETIDDSEKGTSTFISPCAIPSVQRLNNTNIEVKRSYFMSSAADTRNDRLCLGVVPIALFQVFAPDGTAQTIAGAKARENFSYFVSLEMRKAVRRSDTESITAERDSGAQRLLVLYEFNPLNHSINTLSTTPVDPTAYAIFGLPAGEVHLATKPDETLEKNAFAHFTGGPGGVLVCAAKLCEWVNPLQLLGSSSSKIDTKRVYFPQRFDQPAGAHAHIVCGVFQTSIAERGQSVCTGLLQSSLGDVYHLQLRATEHTEANVLDKSIGLTKQATLHDFAMSYFDTIPVARAMHFVENGNALLTINEASDHILYAIREDSLRFHMKRPEKDGIAWVKPRNSKTYGKITETDTFSQMETHVLIFHPKELENLKPFQIMANCAGMTQIQQLTTITEKDGISYPRPRLVGLCGDGSSGALVHFRSEIPSTLLSFKELRESFPIKLFALTPKAQKKVLLSKPIASDPSLLVFSYFDGTLVYSIDSKFAVQETILNAPPEAPTDENAPAKQPDVPIPFDNPTITTTVLSNGDYVQIQRHKLVHFVTGQCRFWKPPADSEIILASANATQIVLAISKNAEASESVEAQTVHFLEYFRQDEGGVLRDPIKLPLNRKPINISLGSRTSLDACAPFLAIAFEGGRVEIWELGKGLIGLSDAVYCVLVLSVPFPIASLAFLANDCENTLRCVESMESSSGVFQRAQKWSLFLGYTNGLLEEKMFFEQTAGDVTLRSIGNQQYQTISSGAQQDVSSLTLRASAMFPCGEAPVRMHAFTKEISSTVALGGRSAKIVSMLYNAAIAVSSATWLLTLPVKFAPNQQQESAIQLNTSASRVKLIDEPVQDICFLGTEGAPMAASSSETTQTAWRFRFTALLVKSSALIVLEVSSTDISGFPLSAYQCMPLLGCIRGPITSGVGFPLCAPPADAPTPNRFRMEKASCTAMPRKLLGVPSSSLAVIIESSHRTLTAADVEADRDALKSKIAEQTGHSIESLTYPAGIPKPRAPDGKWVSFLRVVDLSITRDFAGEWGRQTGRNVLRSPLDQINEGAGVTKDIMELDGNLAAVSLCWIDGTNTFLVGAVRDYHPQGKSFTSGTLLLFSCTPPEESAEGDANEPFIELLHATDIDGIPQAVCALQTSPSESATHVAAGVGDTLHFYAIGTSHMLRKYVHPPFASHIVSLKCIADRLYIGDAMQSVFFARYDILADGLPQCKVFGDDCVMRWITAMEVLDYHTIAAADKFGNFFVVRVPSDVDDSFDPPAENDTEAMLKQIHHLNRTNYYASGGNAQFLNACRQKGAVLANFFVGDVITSIQQTSMDLDIPKPVNSFLEKMRQSFAESDPLANDTTLPNRTSILEDVQRKLQSVSTPILLYSTIGGAIGYFKPMPSAQDAQILEKAQFFFEQCGPLRCSEKLDASGSNVTVFPPAAFPYTASGSSVVDNTFGFSINISENAILGRDRVRYRAMHNPTIGVIDGDFLQQNMRLWSAIAPNTSQSDLRVTLQQIVEGGDSAQRAMVGVSSVLAEIHSSVVQPTLQM